MYSRILLVAIQSTRRRYDEWYVESAAAPNKKRHADEKENQIDRPARATDDEGCAKDASYAIPAGTACFHVYRSICRDRRLSSRIACVGREMRDGV